MSVFHVWVADDGQKVINQFIAKMRKNEFFDIDWLRLNNECTRKELEELGIGFFIHRINDLQGFIDQNGIFHIHLNLGFIYNKTEQGNYLENSEGISTLIKLYPDTFCFYNDSAELAKNVLNWLMGLSAETIVSSITVHY